MDHTPPPYEDVIHMEPVGPTDQHASSTFDMSSRPDYAISSAPAEPEVVASPPPALSPSELAAVDPPSQPSASEPPITSGHEPAKNGGNSGVTARTPREPFCTRFVEKEQCRIGWGFVLVLSWAIALGVICFFMTEKPALLLSFVGYPIGVAVLYLVLHGVVCACGSRGKVSDTAIISIWAMFTVILIPTVVTTGVFAPILRGSLSPALQFRGPVPDMSDPAAMRHAHTFRYFSFPRDTVVGRSTYGIYVSSDLDGPRMEGPSETQPAAWEHAPIAARAKSSSSGSKKSGSKSTSSKSSSSSSSPSPVTHRAAPLMASVDSRNISVWACYCSGAWGCHKYPSFQFSAVGHLGWGNTGYTDAVRIYSKTFQRNCASAALAATASPGLANYTMLPRPTESSILVEITNFSVMRKRLLIIIFAVAGTFMGFATALFVYFWIASAND